MEWVIGIDPGINYTGVAVLHRRVELVYLAKRVNSKLNSNVFNQAAQLQSALLDFFRHRLIVGKVVSAAIERPQDYPGSPVRVRDLLDLALLAGVLGSSTPYTSMSNIYFPTPREWKGGVGKSVHNQRILDKTPELEPMLKPYPRGQWEHIIDAVGIAKWRQEK